MGRLPVFSAFQHTCVAASRSRVQWYFRRTRISKASAKVLGHYLPAKPPELTYVATVLVCHRFPPAIVLSGIPTLATCIDDPDERPDKSERARSNERSVHDRHHLHADRARLRRRLAAQARAF